MSERSEYGPREYLSDDRDLEENRLIIDQGGNGDWYVKIVRPGERVGVAVRVTTSGARRGAEHVARAVFGLYKAMGGQPSGDSKLIAASRELLEAFGVDLEHTIDDDLPVALQMFAAGTRSRRRSEGQRCTGIAASWCPRCGDCKCPARGEFAGDMDSPDCPLHALNSTHGDDPEGA